MDFDGMDTGIKNTGEKMIVNADTKTETNAGNEIKLHESVSLLKSFTLAVSGKENLTETPDTDPNDLVDKMREIVFKTFEDNEKATGKTHLEVLAEKQGKQLRGLPQLQENRTPDEELEFLRILTNNIHEVQNGSSLGITPNMSLELNCMDCSMSTWVMVYEAKKRGIKVDFGSPIGHAVGIFELADGSKFYADGQKGFVEEITTKVETLPGGSKIIEIVNYESIQVRQKEYNGVKEFFPQYVFVDSQGGVSATMSNLDSMLYKQFTGEITDEIREKHSPGYIEEVEVLQPYARVFQNEAASIVKERMEEIKQKLSPDLVLFRQSQQYMNDSERHIKLVSRES